MPQYPTTSKAAAAALLLGAAVVASPAAAHSERPAAEARARIVRITDDAPATMSEAASLLTFGTTLSAVLALLLLVMLPERKFSRER